MPKAHLYPTIDIDLIKNPSRFYAIPLLGGLIKLILLIPVGIELLALTIVNFFMLCICSFVVLFTGKYWHVAYEFLVGYMRLQAKANFYFAGLTNTYPGFSLNAQEFNLTIAYPERPNRWFAVPLLGFLSRISLLIPFSLYTSIIQLASHIAVIFSWITVLLFGTYPETTYEIVRDSQRLSFAMTSYIAGLSDTYPNFWISLNHKRLKLLLIIIAALLILWNYSGAFTSHQQQNKEQYNISSATNKTY